MGWNAVETAPGVYDDAVLRNYHEFFAGLPPATRVIVDVEGTPEWASGSPNTATPPRDDQAFAGFANFIANAFRGQVSAYEIGNEPDATAFWNGTPAQYAGLLRAAYPAIKSADPAASVILGGLEGNDAAFLAQLYTDGARGSFDAVGVHTDDACNVTAPSVFAFDRGTQTIDRYYFLGFTSVHATMVANGDGAKPIYMTEIGWSSTTVACASGIWAGRKPAGVSAAVQASYLTAAYACLAQPAYSYVKAALWFGLYDNAADPAMLDNYGLLSAGMTPKPAYGAFLDLATHGAAADASCGPHHAAPPRLRVLSPRRGQRVRGVLIVRAVALAGASPIAAIDLFVGRRRLARFEGARASLRWAGVRRLSAGPHTVTLIAHAADGATSKVSVSVRHR